MIQKQKRFRLLETFFWFGLIGIPLLVVLIILLNYIRDNQEFRIYANVEKKQQEMLSLSKYQLESLFKGVYDDLNVIRRSNDFSDYLSDPTERTREEAGGMFIRFLNSKPQFLQISYMDSEGWSYIGAERSGPTVSGYFSGAPKSETDRAALLNMAETDGDELYVSDFKLASDGAGYIKPYQPIIRFAVPVYKGSSRSGFLLIDYDGFIFLKILNTYEDRGTFSITQAIIDNDHYIDMNAFDSDDTLLPAFSEPSPEAVELWRLIGNRDLDSFDFNGLRYYARQIDSDDTFSLHFDGDSFHWILISSYDRRDVVDDWGVVFIRNPLVKFSVIFFFELLVLVVVILVLQRKADFLQMEASRYIAEFSHDGIIITDSRQNLIYCNGVFERTFDYAMAEIIGRRPNDFLGGQTTMSFKESDRKNLIWEGNVWDKTKQDIFIQKYLKVKVVKTSVRKPAFYIGVYSEPKFIDNTGLGMSLTPSAYFSEKSMEYLYPDMGKSFQLKNLNTVILIKITDLAFLNNQLPEEETDSLVLHLVREIRRIDSGLGTIVVPASGFILLATRHDSAERLTRFIEDFNRVASSLKINGHDFPVQYKAGVATVDPDADSCGSLVHNAFIALEALETMKDVIYLVFNKAIYETVIRNREIKNEMENAFQKEEFSVAYQVQADCQSREIIGAEALLRWNNERLGWVSPALFVPIMEETSQIKRLGKHVVGKILEEFDSIAAYIDDKFRISINLSIQEFNDVGLVEEIIGMISRSRVGKDKICFEITETILSENLGHTSAVIEKLHENGMKVAIDDFGTGYSSLSYLKNLKADKIKIDRAFIKDYPEKDNGSILKAITNLALDLNINLILEGIETEEQLAFARDIGCREFQGYLSSKPMPIDALAERLKNRPSG